MGGPMPLRAISRGSTLRKMEAHFRDKTNRHEVLTELHAGRRSFGEILERRRVISHQELQDLRKKWFEEYWTDFLPLEGRAEILSAGWRKALERSLGLGDDGWWDGAGAPTRDKPIVTHWICAGYHFQCIVGESEQQVTLLILTPPPPDEGLSSPLTVHENLWLVGSFDDVHKLKKVAETYPPFGHEPIDPAGLVPSGLKTKVYCGPIYGEQEL